MIRSPQLALGIWQAKMNAMRRNGVLAVRASLPHRTSLPDRSPCPDRDDSGYGDVSILTEAELAARTATRHNHKAHLSRRWTSRRQATPRLSR